MTAKEYLKQIERLDKRVELLRERIEETETALTSITMDLSKERVQGGKGGNRYDLVERLDELTDEAIETQLLLLSRKTKVALQIQSLSRPEYMHILTERYIKHRKLSDIAEDPETKYCDVHIYRLHGEALQEFAEKFAPFEDEI